MANKLHSLKHIYGKANIIFSPFDIHIGKFLSNQVQEYPGQIFILGCYLSMQQRSGNIAIDLSKILDIPFSGWPGVATGITNVELDLIYDVTISQVHLDSFTKDGILKSADTNDSNGDTESLKDDVPLVLFDNWLYFLRYWRYENDIVEYFQSNSVYKPVDAIGDFNAVSVKSGDDIDWQKVAVQKALAYPASIITGGPGTGKTYTILSILAQIHQSQPFQKVALCAPTGKAAARMMESIADSVTKIESVMPLIPKEAVTIHRLIGWNPGAGKPKYHAGNKLDYQMVILDEASMVDLALLNRLIAALPDECRFIMLGDKDQLASVEAGSVFGEITSGVQTQQAGDYNLKTENVGFDDILVRLTKSRRFTSESGIGILAEMVNAGESDISWSWLEDNNQVRICHSNNSASWEKEILNNVTIKHQKLLDVIENLVPDLKNDGLSNSVIGMKVNMLLSICSESQILSAHRVGGFGSVYLNSRIDSMLSSPGKSYNWTNIQQRWYSGRPIMVTSNDYELGLFNGDVGLAVQIDDEIRITFGYDGSTEQIRWFSPAQLTNIETSWVLTVHKSQGSEYEKVDLIIPDETSPVLSRELAYTALTRSRNRFELWGTEKIWKEMIKQKVDRKSGLGSRLAGLNRR